MAASDSFNLIAQSDSIIDKYTLYPMLWQSMASEVKKEAVAVVLRNGDDAWSAPSI